jgi:sacsin
MVNPGLGLPHITQVVRCPQILKVFLIELTFILIQISHLSALSSLPIQNQFQRRIIIHDMIETLKWLNENVDDSDDNTLYDLQYENIFLNVDDPSTEPWDSSWKNANELAFEAEDIDGGIRCVRQFLLPYDKLLRAAGVVHVIHPHCPASNISKSASDTLQSIRTGFNDLRRKGLWTDVVFLTTARDDDDTGSVPSLVAHRSFLSVFSDYFVDLFCGEFREAHDASSSNPIQFPVERSAGDYYSTECVQLLLGAFHLLCCL